jgi:hypothetical protein
MYMADGTTGINKKFGVECHMTLVHGSTLTLYSKSDVGRVSAQI